MDSRLAVLSMGFRSWGRKRQMIPLGVGIGCISEPVVRKWTTRWPVAVKMAPVMMRYPPKTIRRMPVPMYVVRLAEVVVHEPGLALQE
jgi:hypothetical protein